MRFGTTVQLLRGGHVEPSPGQFRLVRVRYLGAQGSRVYCELLQDDPDAVAMCKQCGDRGWWERSVLRGEGQA